MWVVQSNFLDKNQINPVAETLRANGIAFVGVDVIPFSQDFRDPLPFDGTVKDIVPYGSTSLCKNAETRGWTGLWFDRDLFNVKAWLLHRDDMLNQDAEIMTVAEAHKYCDTLEQWHADEVEVFVRPCADLKEFNGTMTSSTELRHFMTSVDSGNFSFSADTEIAISCPKNILAEWRWFIVDSKIVDGSMYRMRGMKLTKREQDKAVIAEAQRFADRWTPHDTCVMDLALTEEGVKVIEFNCFNGSGFYYHDIPKIIVAANDYFEKTR